LLHVLSNMEVLYAHGALDEQGRVCTCLRIFADGSNVFAQASLFFAHPLLLRNALHA
jgi:hypothetical protein